MQRLALLVALVLASSGAQASSYFRIDGVTIDPIQNVSGGDHPYSGTNLGAGASLVDVDLAGANLVGAVLTDATMTGASVAGGNLAGADLTRAVLSSANLSGVSFGTAYNGLNVNLSGTDLTGANLSGLTGLAFVTGVPYYDASTNFSGAWTDDGTIAFDPVTAGWALVPEPSTAFLLGLGLAGMAGYRRI